MKNERDDAVTQAQAAGDQLTALLRDFWGPMAKDMQGTLINLGIEYETRSRIISGIVLKHYTAAVEANES
jgi:hypothetical protein